MPSVPSPSSYRRQLDEWTRILSDASTASAAIGEIENVAASVIRSLGVWLNARGIDEKLKAWNTFDPGDIYEAIEILRAAPSEPMLDDRDSTTYLDRLREQLDAMPRLHGNDELPSSFQMLDHLLEHALLNISDRWNHRPLTTLVSRHLEYLSIPQRHKVWNTILWECDTTTSPDSPGPASRETSPDDHPENGMRFLTKGTPSMAEDFLEKPATATSLRERIAEYSTWWRTRLYRDAVRRGRRQFPVDRPMGLGRALSLKSALAYEEPSESERALAMSLGRLCVITAESHRLYDTAEATLGLDRSGPILGVHARVRDRRSNEPQLPRESYLLFHLSRLLWACEEVSGSHPRIRHLLHRYRLRLELCTKEVLTEIPTDPALDSTKEVDFQRDLCRFLLIHGVQGIGTRIGASQTDVVIGDDSGLHLLETKLCRAAPSADDLMRRLPQVSTYQRDFQQPPASSTLVVFNVSKILLTGPTNLRIGDISIMFINLVRDPASKRRRERHFDVDNGRLVSADNSR